MLLLKDPYLELLHQYIETVRCIIVPYSTDGIVNLKDLNREFNKANKNLWITDSLRDPSDEIEYIKTKIIAMGNGAVFENFILNKETGELLGCIGLNTPEEDSVRIVQWVRKSEIGKGYHTEAYQAMLDWARKNTYYTYLIHTSHKDNEASGLFALKFGGIIQNRRTSEGYYTFHIPL